MSIWTQYGDDATNSITPDGRAITDVYVSFTFSGETLPAGSPVKFVAGAADVFNSIGGVMSFSSEQDLLSRVRPIDGVVLSLTTSDIRNMVVRDEAGELSVRPVAKTSLLPIRENVEAEEVVVVAYSGYDGLASASRIVAQAIRIPISPSVISFSIRDGAFYGNVQGDDVLYVAGGWGMDFMSSGEKYDVSSSSLSQISPMRHPRAFGASVELDGMIYAIGGIDHDGATPFVERYVPETDFWELMHPLPFPLAFHSACALNGYIYVAFGAFSVTRDFEPEALNGGYLRFDTASGTWSLLDVVLSGAPSDVLASTATKGDKFIEVSSSAEFYSSGFVTLARGTSSQVTVRYVGFDGGFLVLAEPLAAGPSFSAGTTVHQASLPVSRLCGNAFTISPGYVRTINGMELSMSDGGEVDQGAYEDMDPSTGAISTGASSYVKRFKASICQEGNTYYLAGGANDASDWDDEVETFTYGSPSPTITTPLPIQKSSPSIIATSSLVTAVGGSSPGRPSGWVRIIGIPQPTKMSADGIQNVSVNFSVRTASGAFPPVDTPDLVVEGILVVEEGGQEVGRIRSEKILLSSQTAVIENGEASVVLLPRSEDYLSKVEKLLTEGRKFEAGQPVLLYKIILTAKVPLVDPILHVGMSDTYSFLSDSNARIGRPTKTLFSPSPCIAQQGASARIDLVADTASVPDISTIAEEVSATVAQALLNVESFTIPRGGSPLYDAMAAAAVLRSPIPEVNPPTNMLVALTDSDPNLSASTPQDVVGEFDAVAGNDVFPAFVVSISTGTPTNLPSRIDRTDNPELDYLADNTGGESYSLYRSADIASIRQRLMAAAKSSIGHGTLTMTRDVDGYLNKAEYTVSSIGSGDGASMVLKYSPDGREFVDLGVVIPPNVSYVIDPPIKCQKIEYTVSLTSETLTSPVLEEVKISFISPSVVYLFSPERDVDGELSEVAVVTNHDVASPGVVQVGFSHGDGVDFERTFFSRSQPLVTDRGTMVSVNRAADTVVDDELSRDKMDSGDMLVYSARGGPWSLGSTITVYVNNFEETAYTAIPSQRVVVFDRKLKPSDVVTIEVHSPSSFRVGVRVENPSLSTASLDGLAYCFGETEFGSTANSMPRAVGLAISPAVVRPGGPMTATYTFISSSGGVEDTSRTKIRWFRNGEPVPELDDKRTFSDANLLLRSERSYKITKGQKWFFTVQPSDGSSFGQISRSPVIVVQNSLPVAQGVTITPIGGNTFISGRSIRCTYTFVDADSDSDSGTIIQFVVNGSVVQSGSSDTLLGTATSATGERYISAGNEVSAIVVPSDGTDFGLSVSSAQRTIEASAPSVTNVVITPVSPSSANPLVLTYTFTDPDALGDKSRITWYKNNVRVAALDNLKTVSAVFTSPNQSWYALVSPSNGALDGVAVKSTVVVIGF